MAICKNCGTALADSARFCWSCGAKQEEAPVIAEEIPVTVALEPVDDIPVTVALEPVDDIPVTVALEPVEEEIPAPAAFEAAEEAVEEAPAAVEEAAEEVIEEIIPAAPMAEEPAPVAAPVIEEPVAAPVIEEPVAEEVPAPKKKKREKKQKQEIVFEESCPEVPAPVDERKKRVVSVAGYFWSFVLLGLPVIGLLCAIVWALGGTKRENRKNMARAWLLLLLVCLVIVAIAYLVLQLAFPHIANRLVDFIVNFVDYGMEMMF